MLGSRSRLVSSLCLGNKPASPSLPKFRNSTESVEFPGIFCRKYQPQKSTICERLLQYRIAANLFEGAKWLERILCSCVSVNGRSLNASITNPMAQIIGLIGKQTFENFQNITRQSHPHPTDAGCTTTLHLLRRNYAGNHT